MDELAAIYDSAGELKRAILICFKASEDPRTGFSTRARQRIRHQAVTVVAGGLAVERAARVAELVGLLDSDAEVPQPSRMPYVTTMPLTCFAPEQTQRLGIRDEEIWKPIESRTDLNAREGRPLRCSGEGRNQEMVAGE